MELSADLPPERPVSPETEEPQLRLVGGLAVEQMVDAISTEIDMMPDDEFRTYVHIEAFRPDSLDALGIIDKAIDKKSAELTVQISQMTQQLHLLYERKRWIQGYQDDRK